MSVSKTARQKLILKIIGSNKIASLSELQDSLQDSDVHTDVSTLSRDISQLRIGKKNGHYLLTDNFEIHSRMMPSKRSVFRQFVLSYEAVGNTVIVKTLPGSATAVALSIDSVGEMLNLAGTIAGDDTVFALLRSEEHARRTVGWLEETISREVIITDV